MDPFFTRISKSMVQAENMLNICTIDNKILVKNQRILLKSIGEGNLYLGPIHTCTCILKDFENASPRLNPLFHKP